MKKIQITVILTAKENTAAELKNQLIALVALSRKETGCLQYDLHQNTQKSNVYVLHEIWENEAIFEKHNNQEYVKAFFALAPSLLEKEAEIIFTQPIV